MRIGVFLNVMLLLVLLINSIIHNLPYQQEGPGDLRNRVVGARMLAAGKLPYFYKWRKGDSYRYLLDNDNRDSNIVSKVTATPFFHRLLIPIAGFNEKTIVYIWFALEYLALAVIILAGFLLCSTGIQKLIVLNTGILFLYTHAWLFHLYVGQVYIFVAALFMVIALLLIKYPRSLGHLAVAGCLTAIVIFVRPIAGIMLLPFIFALHRYRNYLLATFISAVVYGSFILFNANERSQWISYRTAMTEQVKIHQGLPHAFIKPDPFPPITDLEGFNLQQQKKSALDHPFSRYSENGNVFFLYKVFTHHMLPLAVLYTLWAIAVLVVLALTGLKYRQKNLTETQLILAGLLLYMITEIFAPVYRHQYNTVQWFPLILLVAVSYKRSVKLHDILIVAGLLLNISNTQLIPMRHIIGEIFILSGLLAFLFENNRIDNFETSKKAIN